MNSDLKLLNRKVVRSWSSTHCIVHGVDQLAEDIKAACGVQCDRSKLLNALCELLIEAGEAVDTTAISDRESLKIAIAKALKKHR